jgi:hypothetical protein
VSVNSDTAKGQERVHAWAPTEVYEGKIANTVSTLADDLYVIIEEPDVDEDPKHVHRDGPVLGWDKRSDGTFPAEGNSCAVARGNRGQLWMIGWKHD